MTQDEAMKEAQKLKRDDLFWCLIGGDKRCLCRFQRLTPGHAGLHMDIQIVKCVTGGIGVGNTTRYQHEFAGLYIPPKDPDAIKESVKKQKKELHELRERELKLRESIAISESVLMFVF